MSRKRALPNIVADALDRIWAGATADDVESAVLDVKEDPAHTPTRDAAAKAVDILVTTATCFANGSAGRAFIVFGIADRIPGPAAFTGTQRDPEDIAHAIFANTRPHLTVDAWSSEVYETRIVIIRIAAGSAVYTGWDGKVKHRVGDACLPLSEAERAELIRARHNPDPTARPVVLPRGALDEQALVVARSLLCEQGRHVSEDAESILRAVDVLTEDGTPTLAAKILFGCGDPATEVARHIFRDAGGKMIAETQIHDPLILATSSLHQLMRSHAQAAIPPVAQEEALNNAFLHRDWLCPDPVVVYQSADLVRVSSPGGLPRGVVAERLLSGPAQPRNPTLVNAMQQLGVVRWSSRGFERMWTSMLSAGFEPPTVDVRVNSLDVVLFDGVADQGFVRALSVIREEFGRGITRDAATLVTLRYLIGRGGMTEAPGVGQVGMFAGSAVISLDRAASMQQATLADARSLMTWLTQRGVLHRMTRRRDEWRLSDHLLEVMGTV